MTRSIVFSVGLLAASLFVGSALKAQAATAPASPAASAEQSTDNVASGGYWAAWAQAAAH